MSNEQCAMCNECRRQFCPKISSFLERGVGKTFFSPKKGFPHETSSAVKWLVCCKKEGAVIDILEEKLLQREKLKKTADIVLIFCTAGLSVNLILGFAIYILGWNRDFTEYMLVMGAVTVVSMLVVSWICAVFCGGMKSCISRQRKKTGLTDKILLVILGFSGCIVINLILTIIVILFPFIGGSDSEISDRTDIYSIMLMTLAVAVSPAVCEEIAFRGFVMGSLSDFGQGFAVILSSMLFGMMHGSLSGMIFAFSVGILLGCIRKTSGSLIPSMIVHFLNNAFSVWTNALSKTMDTELYAELFLIFCICMIVVLGVTGVVVYKRNIGFFEFSADGCQLTTGEKVKITITRPLFWVFAGFVGIMALLQ